MPKKAIQTEKAGPPLGAYSQGIRAGDFSFVSGCGPIDPKTARVRGDSVEQQAEVVIDNLQAILEAGGATLSDVVKATVHLAPRVGTNVLVLNGLMNVMIQSGHLDRAFLEAHTVGFDELSSRVEACTVD